MQQDDGRTKIGKRMRLQTLPRTRSWEPLLTELRSNGSEGSFVGQLEFTPLTRRAVDAAIHLLNLDLMNACENFSSSLGGIYWFRDLDSLTAAKENADYFSRCRSIWLEETSRFVRTSLDSWLQSARSNTISPSPCIGPLTSFSRLSPRASAWRRLFQQCACSISTSTHYLRG